MTTPIYVHTRPPRPPSIRPYELVASTASHVHIKVLVKPRIDMKRKFLYVEWAITRENTPHKINFTMNSWRFPNRCISRTSYCVPRWASSGGVPGSMGDEASKSMSFFSGSSAELMVAKDKVEKEVPCQLWLWLEGGKKECAVRPTGSRMVGSRFINGTLTPYRYQLKLSRCLTPPHSLNPMTGYLDIQLCFSRRARAVDFHALIACDRRRIAYWMVAVNTQPQHARVLAPM